MIIPTDTKVMETDSSYFWLDKAGIVYSESKDVTLPVTEERILEAIEIMKELSKDGKLCILSEVTRIGSSTKKARELIQTRFPRYVQAWAVVVKNPMIRLSLNIIMGFKKTPYAMKIFRNMHEAMVWIRKERYKMDVDQDISLSVSA